MKRFLSLILSLVIVIGIITSVPVISNAASFSDINANSVFIKQQPNTSTCTLCAATNMMRRVSMLRGDSNWATITESSARSSAWISGTGLRGTFNYSNSANGIANISVTCKTLPGNSSNTSILINLLASHPEGIVIYNGVHAVLLTDYTDGFFYCNDPDDEQPVGRVAASRAYSVKPENATKYWYVTSPTVSLGGSSTSSAPSAPKNVRTSTGATAFTTSEYINFCWDASALATDYWVYMWKDGEQIYATDVGNNTSFTSAPTSAGNYTLIVRAGNSVGYSNDPASVDFVVYDSAPEAPEKIWSNSSTYSSKEYFTISWSKVEIATEYWVYMWKDGEQIYATNMGNNTSITSAPTSPGKYTLIVRAGNSFGYSNDPCAFDFTVYDADAKYVITYNSNGGTGAPSSQTKTYGKTLTLSSIKPTRSGYTFIGWSTNKYATAATYSAGSSFTTNADTTLYAIWKVNSYTVYFNANSGSCSTSSKSVTYNSTYGTLPTPTRSGYTFDGWYTAKTGGTKITASTKYTTAGNITLYAHWTQNHSHSYTSQITKAPTCTETGIRKYTCSCGASYTQTIAATGHTSSDWIIYWYPSADSDGYGYRECEVCYDVLDEQYYDQYECDTPYLYEIVNTAKGVKIEWEDVYGADNYFVYRKTYNATTKKWGGWVRFADNVTSTSYTDTTAKSGVYYIYTVRAKNEAGLSGYDSSGLKIKFLATPTLASIANNTGKVTVKWNKVSGATGYIVYRKTYNASTKTWSGWSRLASTKSNSYNDTKAKSGTYYRYTVRAYYGDYVSYFDTTGLKTKYLATPTLKSVASAKSGVTVKWGKVTGATGYIVYRKTGNGSWKQMAVVKGSSKVSYLDKTAKKGTTYKYTVRAYYGSYRSYFNTKGLTIKDKY